MELVPGQIVYSKSGRDKRRAFVVVASDGAYAYLADGDLRRMDKPKKKKYMHIQPTAGVAREIQEKLAEQRLVMDADIRKALRDVARPTN